MSNGIDNTVLSFNNKQLDKIVSEKVVKLEVIDGKVARKTEYKYNLDGSINKSKCNKIAGESSEVYAFRTEEEIKAIMDVFQEVIDKSNGVRRKIAMRNRLIFVIGINVGLRTSDLCGLRWNFFLDKVAGNKFYFKEFYMLQPKKTKRTGKYVKFFFNEAVKKSIESFLTEYPADDLGEYLFPSRKGNGYIEPKSLWRIVKDTAKAAGIKRNIGSYSLRKTWGYWCFSQAEDKNKALVILQSCFNHVDTRTTMKYIGLVDEDMEEMYNSINLGCSLI